MKFQTQVMTYPSMSAVLLLGEADSKVQRAVRYALLALAGSALITLCTQISLPLFPVPMTLQTFAVFLIGLTYGWRLGGVTVALYLLEGAIGLPVFSLFLIHISRCRRLQRGASLSLTLLSTITVDVL